MSALALMHVDHPLYYADAAYFSFFYLFFVVAVFAIILFAYPYSSDCVDHRDDCRPKQYLVRVHPEPARAEMQPEKFYTHAPPESGHLHHMLMSAVTPSSFFKNV